MESCTWTKMSRCQNKRLQGFYESYFARSIIPGCVSFIRCKTLKNRLWKVQKVAKTVLRKHTLPKPVYRWLCGASLTSVLPSSRNIRIYLWTIWIDIHCGPYTFCILECISGADRFNTVQKQITLCTLQLMYRVVFLWHNSNFEPKYGKPLEGNQTRLRS